MKEEIVEAQGIQRPVIRYKASATVAPGTIAANTVYESSAITVTGAVAGDLVLVGPPAAIIAGVTWAGYVSAADSVKIRINNPTVAGIAVPSGTWDVIAVHY